MTPDGMGEYNKHTEIQKHFRYYRDKFYAENKGGNYPYFTGLRDNYDRLDTLGFYYGDYTFDITLRHSRFVVFSLILTPDGSIEDREVYEHLSDVGHFSDEDFVNFILFEKSNNWIKEKLIKEFHKFPE